MKLEFHKCLSVMDRCLVLPHAGLRAKLHAALSAWRKEAELQAENMHSEVGSYSIFTDFRKDCQVPISWCTCLSLV